MSAGKRPQKLPFSIWTILAPVALLAFCFFAFNALGKSCLLKDCETKPAEKAVEKSEPEISEAKLNAKTVKIKEGDSLASIAKEFGYTLAEIQACNPKLDSPTLQPGKFVNIDRTKCEDADK